MLIHGVVFVSFLAGALALVPFFHLFEEQPKNAGTSRAGEPLFLTPYIQKGQLDEAKKLAKVGPIDGDASIPSFSGLLTVNESMESNMFFWFFPAANDPSNAPVSLWLEGGPGVTALFGVFVENGPYKVIPEQMIQERSKSWHKLSNMIYIDSPVGTGYSFTKRTEGFARTEDDVARDLYEALRQFFTLFNEYSKNDFYIMGESYAGKFGPALAYAIHKDKQTKIRLTGLVVGDGYCDPATMLDYASFLEKIALVNRRQASAMQVLQNDIAKAIKKGEFKAAAAGALTLADAIRAFIKPGGGFIYNFLRDETPTRFTRFVKFAQTDETRLALHVGNLNFDDSSNLVRLNLGDDFMRSVKPIITELMEHYKVLMYSGQLDVIVAASLTASFIDSIQWSGAKELAEADRIVWKDLQTGYPAGYVRRVKNFTEVFVRDAGHTVIFDRPQRAYDMIKRFLTDKPFGE